MYQDLPRRKILTGVGSVAAAGAIAGCTGDENGDENEPTPAETPTVTTTETPTEMPTPEPGIDPAELDGYIRPEDDPETVPADLDCDIDGFERRSGWIDEDVVEWGEATNDDGRPVFGLRVDTLTVERGEAVTITLTNISGEDQTTANPYKADLDVYTESGWHDPRGWEDGQPNPVTDDVWTFEPAESYEWHIELTEEGVVDADYHDEDDSLVTCPELSAGRYRFATSAPEQGDVAIAFDLVE